jgi:hypothetical protein
LGDVVTAAFGGRSLRAKVSGRRSTSSGPEEFRSTHINLDSRMRIGVVDRG